MLPSRWSKRVQDSPSGGRKERERERELEHVSDSPHLSREREQGESGVEQYHKLS